MSPDAYVRAVIDCYLEQRDTPQQATATDSAIASDLHARGVDLEHILHAIRLAALRRATVENALSRISSLAYFRRVLEQLRPEELDTRYRTYVEQRYRQLDAASANTPKGETSARSRITALSRSR